MPTITRSRLKKSSIRRAPSTNGKNGREQSAGVSKIASQSEPARRLRQEVLDRCDRHQVQVVNLWFTDILGQLKSFSINSAELEDAFAGGNGFDGSSITGFNPIEESDMLAVPDPATFTTLPWSPEEQPTGRMFCDIRVPGGEPYEGDPRWILRRAIQRAGEMGFDAFNVGPELEYFYFRDAKPADGVPEVLDEGGYFDLTTLDAGSGVRRETVLALEQMGIEDPIVVRLDGTNAEEGRRLLLEAAKPNVHAEATMLDGARRAVELAGAEA